MRLDQLTCEEAFRKLDDFVDRELSDVEMARIRHHLEVCEACAREFAYHRSVLHELRVKVGRLAAPETLRTRLTDALRQARERSDR